MVQFIRIIKSQADGMRDLISELLDVARIETGTLSVNPEPADVAALVDEARNIFTSGGGKNTIDIDIEPELPWVMADSRRIIQVLGNLLSNAARHSHETSPIQISASLGDRHVVIEVSDKGQGVSEERLPLLFRKFSQGDGYDGERDIAGSGMGLPICKGIVEAHGGRIWAESDGPGMGTRFTFTIPASGEGSPALESLVQPGRTPRSKKNQARILAVDDDPRTLRYVRDTLSQAGYVPVVTGDPEEALRLVETTRPLLVILDLVLPGTDGIELMRRIRNISNVPVIFLSAYGRDEIIARAFEAGAVDYIVKPFSPTELTTRVGGALRRRLTPSLEEEPPEPFVLGDLTINYIERRVNVGGQAIHLTPTEYGLLCELSMSPGRVLTHDALLERVWGVGHRGGKGSVRTYVKRLRHKLGEDAEDPKYIFAEPRVGYRMGKPGSGD